MNSSYREFCYWPRWFYVLLILPMLVVPVLAFFATSESERWAALIPVPIFVAVLVWFGRLELRADAGGVFYGFRNASNFVPWSRVNSMEPEDYRFSRYWGWGWRIGGVRDRAYSLLGYKRGVRLRFEDEKGREWSIFLSSRDPAAMCRHAPSPG